MKDNLYLSRRKDDILIEYYFVCGYICFEKKKKGGKKKHRPLSLSLSRLPSLTPALPPCCCVHFFLHGQRGRPATTGHCRRAPATTQGRAAAALLPPPPPPPPPCCCVPFFLQGQRGRPATTGHCRRAPATTQGRAAAALLLLLRFFWRNTH